MQSPCAFGLKQAEEKAWQFLSWRNKMKVDFGSEVFFPGKGTREIPAGEELSRRVDGFCKPGTPSGCR